MEREAFKSTQVRSAGWEQGKLEIEFCSGAVYEFQEVPEDVWKAFQLAESKGRYFSTAVRGLFKYKCVFKPLKEKHTDAEAEKKSPAKPKGAPKPPPRKRIA